MHAAVSYVVEVFLYMALKQARAIEHREYDEALRRAAGLGERMRAKLVQRTASLYNGILVGPNLRRRPVCAIAAAVPWSRIGAGDIFGCSRTDEASRSASLFLWRRS